MKKQFDFDKFFDAYRASVQASQTTTLKTIFQKYYGIDIDEQKQEVVNKTN